jgi:hypothetical protein
MVHGSRVMDPVDGGGGGGGDINVCHIFAKLRVNILCAFS